MVGMGLEVGMWLWLVGLVGLPVMGVCSSVVGMVECVLPSFYLECVGCNNA